MNKILELNVMYVIKGNIMTLIKDGAMI